MNLSSLKFITKHWVACGISQLQPVNRESGLHRCLMYHSIENELYDSGDLYSLSKKKFTQQIALLKKLAIPLRAFDSWPQTDVASISVTFDDGFLDNFTVAMPILVANEIPFTVFVVSDFVDPKHTCYLNRNHLLEMVKNPLVTIGAHGKSHVPLTSLSLKDAREEMQTAKIYLEDIIGKEVTTMSFPHGMYNDELIRCAVELGYRKCGTSVALPNKIGQAGARVDRQAIFFCESDISFRQKLEGRWDWVARR